MKAYDIIVIGAGPIGSYTAYQLADRGFDVCLLDKKSKAGADVVCSGIISTQAFKRYELPFDSILTKLDSFTFISPKLQRLEYSQAEPFAYAVDRRIFDRDVFKMAKNRGVETHLRSPVTKIEEYQQYCNVYVNRKKYQSKVVIIATGNNYRLQTILGMGKVPKFLYGYQVELSMPVSSRSTALIHLGNDIAPGSFGWVIPIRPNYARVGVLTEYKSRKWLINLIRQRIGVEFGIEQLKARPIACGLVKKTVRKRILSVGEAAGQVKTTTGGGVYYGLLCSEIAVDKITRALRSGFSLADYETTWRSVLVAEIRIGLKLRKIAATLKDEQIDNMFSFVKRNRYWIQLLLPRINFDYHSNMLSFCIETFRYVMGLADS